MANEYLERTPTSNGNRRTWTLSCWLKQSAVERMVVFGSRNASTTPYTLIRTSSPTINFEFSIDAGTDGGFEGVKRDVASWYNLVVSIDTTQEDDADRITYYINGKKLNYSSTQASLTKDTQLNVNEIRQHVFGLNPGYDQYWKGEICDAFLVDGQALTPDVFGFYKDGDGYISAGSTQSTDFRPGQWVPKKPSVIKNSINNSGGFGVNGFYLPMNDSSNFGADFHCDPNSIITLQDETAAQPKNGAPTTTDAYVSQLRSDPYAANLVLAVPGITGATGVAYSDFSANIKGSGTNKTLTANGNAGVAVTASYYGSAMNFDGNGDYFTHTSNSDFQFGTGDFTVEFWMKRTDSGTNVGLLDTRTTNTDGNGWFIRFTAATTIQLVDNATQYASLTHSSDWNHIAFVRDSNLITGYVNGVAGGITTDASTNFSSSNFLLGGFVDAQASPNGYGGYIQDLRVYKGVAKYTGGFDVPKPYTPVGIATWRAVPDMTANNFATLNPLYVANTSGVSYSDGNLFAQSSSNDKVAQGTMAFTSGKWYWETRIYNDEMIGFGRASASMGNYPGNNDNGFSYHKSGSVFFQGTSASYGAGWSDATYQIIGIAVDKDNDEVYWSVDGVWANSANPSSGTGGRSFAGISSLTSDGVQIAPAFRVRSASGLEQISVNFGQNPTFSGSVTAGTNADDSGKGLFKYAPPSGFLALCEDNLPTPAIADPGDHFKCVLYEGDNNNGRGITGVGFKPDLVWTKIRSSAGFYHIVVDSVRGPNRALFANATSNENITTVDATIQSFDNDGFSLALDPDSNSNSGWNRDGEDYVAWCWKAGAGTTSANTDGSINSVVSVNQDAGFSIVSYTGNATDSTVGHGLNKTPGFIIVKKRNGGADWPVYHHSLSTQEHLVLNTTAEKASSTDLYYQDPTSSVFYIGDTSNAINASGGTYIAYCWAEIEGFSKFGSYIGNGSTDGPFVYCGFKPAWVMIKIADTTTNGWVIMDNARKSVNPNGETIFANNTDAEYTDISQRQIDFLSNGFKIRATGSERNTNTATYVFAAFAESPFKTANAK